MYYFPNLEPICCSMSGSNCCFLTCMQISQETGKVVWYSLLLKNFPQFIVIHSITILCGIVNKADIDVFLELSFFFDDPADVGNLISGFSAFSKTSCQIYLLFYHCWILITWKGPYVIFPFCKDESPNKWSSLFKSKLLVNVAAGFKLLHE